MDERTLYFQNLVLRCLKVVLIFVLLTNHTQHSDTKDLVKEIDEFIKKE